MQKWVVTQSESSLFCSCHLVFFVGRIDRGKGKESLFPYPLLYLFVSILSPALFVLFPVLRNLPEPHPNFSNSSYVQGGEERRRVSVQIQCMFTWK